MLGPSEGAVADDSARLPLLHVAGCGLRRTPIEMDVAAPNQS